MVSVNHLRTTPEGLDITLQSIQKDLYNYLSEKWSGGPLQGSGRVYRNPKEGNTVPERWNGKGYEDVYFDDSYAASFFFIDDTTHESTDGMVFMAKVKLAFLVNLDKIKTILSAERLDEQARHDVISYLRTISDGRYTITGIQKGVDAVFAGFDKSRIQLTDMHPKHTFCINLNVFYYTDQCT